jgi:hypothetical protein
MKKHIIVVAIVVIVACGGSFYAGMKYTQAGRQKGFANMALGGQVFERNGQGGAMRGGNGGIGGAMGEVIAKDASSITIKLRDGGSKIILFSGTTEISKSVSGVPNDVAVGKSVMVSGTANQDGSITAQSIQIRPPMPSPTVSPIK